MLTAQMPALAQALAGSLPPAALQQLMQALGNCQQSLSHRGRVALSPAFGTQPNGLARTGTWRPSDYPGYIPPRGDGGTVDVPGGGGSYTTTHNGGDTYNLTSIFPINSEFTTNNYYGGDTFTVEGDSYFDNSTHTTLTTTNLNVTEMSVTIINGQPVPPPGGGDDGADGPAGPGGGGGVGPGGGGFPGPIFIPPGASAVKTFVTDVRAGNAKAKVQKAKTASVPAGGLKTTLEPGTQPYTVESTGTLSVPVATSGTVASLSATGNINIPTVSSASISGITASFTGDKLSIPTSAALSGLAATCSVDAPIPTSGTLSGLKLASSAVAFNIPNSVTLPSISATSSALSIPTKATVSPSGTATVTVTEVTGGFVDSSCKFVPTTQQKTYTVTLPSFTCDLTTSSVTPTITVAYNGSASLGTQLQSTTPTISVTDAGTIALSQTKNTTVAGTVSFTSHGTISLNSTAQAVTGSVAITNQGTISLTPSTTTVAATLTAPGAKVDLNTEPQVLDLKTTGSVTIDTIKTVTVDGGQTLPVANEEAEVNVPIDPALRVKKDFIVYYRPRF